MSRSTTPLFIATLHLCFPVTLLTAVRKATTCPRETLNLNRLITQITTIFFSELFSFLMKKGFVKHFRINISDIKIERRFNDSISSLSSSKYKFGLCETDYVGYTSRHLFQRIAEHSKHSSIAEHLKEEHGLQLNQLIYKTSLQF